MTAAKQRVAVLFGGRSAEHEISFLSARFVVAMLDRDRFEPTLIGIDKAGRWLLQDEALLRKDARDPRYVKLAEDAPHVVLSPHPNPSGGATLIVGSGERRTVDVVFPVLHGPMGEDGCTQGLLELSGVPYVGSGVLGSAVSMDKDIAKRLLKEAGLPIVPYIVVRKLAWERDKESVLRACHDLGEVLFVKPVNMGSSVGISRVGPKGDLAAAIDEAFAFDLKVIIEAGVPGPRELEISVLGNEEPIASVPGEIVIDHPDGFYSYAAKYVDEKGAVTKAPANLTPEQTAEIQKLAIRTFQALEGSGLARVDFFLDASGKLYVNEINTIPGFTSISMYPKLWEASGVPGKELVTRLIDLALDRAQKRAALRTTK